jgi:HK97 family phage portal protein
MASTMLERISSSPRVQRARAELAPRVQRARTVARSIIGSTGYTMPGPYTSIFVSGNGMAPWLMRVPEQVAMSIGAFYRGVSIFEEMISTMPVTRLRGRDRLDDPPFIVHPAGTEVGWTDEIGQIVRSLILRGNGYALPTAWAFDGFPSAFTVLDPDQVGVEIDASGANVIYSWTNLDGSSSSIVNPDGTELLHLRLHRPPGCFMGVGVLDAAGMGIGTAFATEQFAGDVVANPVPPAILNSALRLNGKQAGDLQAQWIESLANASGAPAVLSGGVTYQPLQVTPRDVELIAARQWNVTQIAVLLGLPPMYLGGDLGRSLTYTTTESEFARLWTMALMPVSVVIERAFGSWVPRGHRIRFVPDSVLRAQTLDRYRAYQIGLAAGFLTVDEVRETEHLGELPEELTPSTENTPPPADAQGGGITPAGPDAQAGGIPPAGPDQSVPAPAQPTPIGA